MTNDDMVAFEKLTQPEQNLIRAFMRFLISERRVNKKRRFTNHRIGYTECAWCGEVNDCYEKDGKPRCKECRRESPL